MSTLSKTLWHGLLLVLCISIVFTLRAQDAEKQKIVQSIKDELTTFGKKDYAGWATHWIHSNKVLRFASGAGYVSRIATWDSLNTAIKGYFDEPGPGYQGSKSDFDVNVQGNMAVVHLKETGDGGGITQTLIMQKENKDWKIAEMYSYDNIGLRNGDPTIEASLNAQGYNLMAAKKLAEATKLFTFNAELYPESANAWDSLGEAHMKGGDKQKAKECYEKSLALNPKNENAKKYIAELNK